MARKIILIGGPKNGETIELPEQPPTFRLVQFPSEPDDGSVTYTICQSGDGYFYGVFNPSDDDPSVARIKSLRAAILDSMQ